MLYPKRPFCNGEKKSPSPLLSEIFYSVEFFATKNNGSAFICLAVRRQPAGSFIDPIKEEL